MISDTIPNDEIPAAASTFGPIHNSFRLIVDHIVLENFKSYAGRQVIGPFHQNFTSIVGPNGSGKSNVIDAFMFVLGYRAKKLRQGRLSELIHNSEGLLNLESCTVEVHFKLIETETGRLLKDVSVGRTAYKNNSNKYTINGGVSNYIEVTGMLKHYGVDLDHKRFLILQGEVESIAQMKPKASNEHEEGLLEYLEDIIGTNKYIEKIEEAGKSVDSANEICAEKIVRVKSAEKEVQALSEEKEEAENFIRKDNKVTIKKAELYQIMKYRNEVEIEKLMGKLDKIQSELKIETDKNNEKCSELEGIEQKLKELVNLHTKHEAQISLTLKRLNSLEKDDIKLQETRKHLKNKIKTLAKSLSDESKNRSNILKEIGDNEQEIKLIEEAVLNLQKDLVREETELSKATETLKGETGDLQSQLEQLQKQLSPWNEKICQEQDAYEGSVLALKAFEKKQRANCNELGEAEKQLKTVENELFDAQKSQKTLQSQKEEFKVEIVRLESEISAGEEIQTSLSSSINTIQSTLAEANEALRQGNSGSAALSALMKESSSGRIKGIHGRLGDLGIIDPKYDCAITTACSSLNFIVVEDTQAGQKCVEHLRRNNLGRASFIILEKMRKPELNPNYLPTGAQRLFDLVEVKNEKILPAFYYALNDTLVARNMEDASKLAYGGHRRFRVVTLDGKLIDTSGTMSGGGSNQQSGGMKATFTPEISREQLSELNAILAEKLAEQRAVKGGLMKFQELLSKTKIDLKRTEMELGKVEIAIKSLPQQISDLKESIQTIKDVDMKPSSAEIEKENQLKAQKIQHETNIEELKLSCASIQKSIDSCQHQILEAGGTRFKAQRSKVNDLKDQIKLQEKRAAKLAAQKNSLEKQTSGSGSDNLAASNSELLGLENELKVIEDSIQNTTMEAFKIKKEHEELLKESENFKETISEMKKDQEAIGKELNKFRKREFELKSQNESISKQAEDLSKQILGLDGAIQKLAINPIKVSSESEAEAVIPILSAEEMMEQGSKSVNQLEQSIKTLETELSEMRPNLKVIQEFKHRQSVYVRIKEEFEELERSRDATRIRFETLRKLRYDEFMNGFRQISLRLKELYQLITMGGNAELELVDSLDPFTEGILFSVMPPKKSWKNISNLSGGEKTLSSLALVFALHTFKPTPIYVMDEIDAALDFRNVSIVANYLKERTKDAQFIVISLRNNMFELADRLVGIYKTSQQTKSVTIDPKSFCIKSQ